MTNGRLIGRPGSTLESQYLLTGFLECGLCGGSVYVSKQNTQRGELIRYYLCATQRTRGTCPDGGIRIRMESLDAAVLDEIEAAVLTPARLTSLVERVAARLSAAAAQAPGREAALERQLREAKARVGRYVAAIGKGVAVTEIRAALSEAKAQAAALELLLADLGSAPPSRLDLGALERRVADWRAILRRGPVMARQILRKLLPGRLALLPAEDGVAFRGVAACAGVLAGLAYVRTVVPPG